MEKGKEQNSGRSDGLEAERSKKSLLKGEGTAGIEGRKKSLQGIGDSPQRAKIRLNRATWRWKGRARTLGANLHRLQNTRRREIAKKRRATIWGFNSDRRKRGAHVTYTQGGKLLASQRGAMNYVGLKSAREPCGKGVGATDNEGYHHEHDE